MRCSAWATVNEQKDLKNYYRRMQIKWHVGHVTAKFMVWPVLGFTLPRSIRDWKKWTCKQTDFLMIRLLALWNPKAVFIQQWKGRLVVRNVCVPWAGFQFVLLLLMKLIPWIQVAALETQLCNWLLLIFSSFWVLANETIRGNTKQTEPISFLVLQGTVETAE